MEDQTSQSPVDPARLGALELMAAILSRKQPLDDAFEREATSLNPTDRAFLRQLAATTLRRLGQIDNLIDLCLKKPLPKQAEETRDILRLGIAQLLFMNVPAHAAINTSVEMAKASTDRSTQGFQGLINAILRRISREGAQMRAQQKSARLNTPDWLWKALSAHYGSKTTAEVAAMHLREPPLDLSLKPGEDAEHWARLLDAKILPTGTLRRSKGGAITDLRGFEEGAWWVQDMAASLPVKLMGEASGKHIIDLCAAPGGKTAQLAAAGASVTAIDRSRPRLARLAENLKRLRLEADIITADGASFEPKNPADAVLLDAPCSTTGTLRRHPDVAWLKTPRDVKTMTALQAKLLENAAKMTAPGGLLVYCTCSLLPEEGEEQITRFLEAHQEFSLAPVTAEELPGLEQAVLTKGPVKGSVRTLPCFWDDAGGMDGFFIARLKKQS